MQFTLLEACFHGAFANLVALNFIAKTPLQHAQVIAAFAEKPQPFHLLRLKRIIPFLPHGAIATSMLLLAGFCADANTQRHPGHLASRGKPPPTKTGLPMLHAHLYSQFGTRPRVTYIGVVNRPLIYTTICLLHCHTGRSLTSNCCRSDTKCLIAFTGWKFNFTLTPYLIFEIFDI